MTKYLTFVLFAFTRLYCWSQPLVISIPTTNIIYLGLQNPIGIAVDGYKYRQLMVKTEGCELYGEYPRLGIKAKSKGKCTVSVYLKRNKKHMGSYEFKVTNVPLPSTFFGNLESGKFSVNELLETNQINAHWMNFGLTCLTLWVVSYQWEYYGNSGLFYCSDFVKGNKIPTRLKSLISHGRTGDKIVITRVKSMIAGGTIKELAPVEIYVDSNIYWERRIDFIKFKNENSMITFYDFQHLLTCDQTPAFSPGILYYYEIKHSYSDDFDILRDTQLISEVKIDTRKQLYEKQYYPKGKLKAEYYFEQNDTLGDATLYYENGEIRSKGKVIPWHSNIIEQYDRSIGYLDISTFIDSLVTNVYTPYGNWKGYYKSGALALECNFDLEKVSRQEDGSMGDGSNDHFITQAVKDTETAYRTEVKGVYKCYNKLGKVFWEGNR